MQYSLNTHIDSGEENHLPYPTLAQTARRVIPPSKTSNGKHCSKAPRNVWNGASGTSNSHRKLVFVQHSGTETDSPPILKQHHLLTLHSVTTTGNAAQIRAPRGIWGLQVKTRGIGSNVMCTGYTHRFTCTHICFITNVEINCFLTCQ